MARYTLYFLSEGGRVVARTDFAAQAHTEAEELVERFPNGCAKELWCGELKIRSWAPLGEQAGPVANTRWH